MFHHVNPRRVALKRNVLSTLLLTDHFVSTILSNNKNEYNIMVSVDINNR